MRPHTFIRHDLRVFGSLEAAGEHERFARLCAERRLLLVRSQKQVPACVGGGLRQRGPSHSILSQFFRHALCLSMSSHVTLDKITILSQFSRHPLCPSNTIPPHSGQCHDIAVLLALPLPPRPQSTAEEVAGEWPPRERGRWQENGHHVRGGCGRRMATT